MSVSEKAAMLLGKRITDPELALFLAEYAVPGYRLNPYRQGDAVSIRMPQSGIRLDFDEEHCLRRISFCNPTDSRAAGAFPGEIVPDLNLAAERHEVQAALGLPDSTETSRDHVWDIFSRGLHTLRFEYSRPHDRIRNVSVIPSRSTGRSLGQSARHVH